jgi:hypothetical protein
MLIDDGWSFADGRASHPDVPDEKAARFRLAELGILTSSACLIRFDRVRVRKKRRVTAVEAKPLPQADFLSSDDSLKGHHSLAELRTSISAEPR